LVIFDNIETTKDQELITYHNKFDKNNVIIDTVAFDFEKEESEGTKKLIYLLGAIYDTLMNGKVLFIDELDSKLHPNLTKKLLEFFHKLNCKGAQFIFTVHDAILLDKEIFRRDQIWFVDRDKFGASELYGMSDFDANVVRNTSDFRKKYLDSIFGAAETIDITNELINLMK
jgi:AAA15 family ATPase/GTPase